MADKTIPDTGAPAETPVPASTATAPSTADIVQENNGKELRKLQDRFSKKEKESQDMAGELAELRKLVEAAAKTPSATATRAAPKRTILDDLNDMIFKPKS